MKTYKDIALELAELVERKQEAYGNSFDKATQILQILYPEGISFEDIHNVLVITRILDKISRIATNRDSFNEDPWQDIMGYALLELQRKEREKEEIRNDERPPKPEISPNKVLREDKC
jgi:hypothetical protein